MLEISDCFLNCPFVFIYRNNGGVQYCNTLGKMRIYRNLTRVD